MATIAELVLKLKGDNTEIRQMFADSAQIAQNFTMAVTDAMEMAGRSAAKQAGAGAYAAKLFIDSMENSLKSDLARIQADQVALFITPAQAAEQAGMAALAFNDTLTQTLGQLRASGNLTAGIEAQIMAAFSKIGVKAGVALQESVATGITEGQSVVAAAAQRAAQSTFTPYTAAAEKGLSRVTSAVVNSGGAWTTMGRRGATAAMGLGFAIEQLANGSESGMRRALRSVESFAIFFGPEGLLVAAVITGGLAIYDHFHKIQKAIDDLLVHAVQAASQAANSMDQIGLMKALRDIQQGQATSVDPNSHELIINKRSEFAKDAFEGSAMDLQAHIDRINEQILEMNKTGNVLLVGKLKKQADDLQAQLDPMAKRYSQIRDLILNPPPQMRMPEAPKPIEIKGKSPAEYAAEATKAYYEALGILIERLGAAQAAHQSYADVLMKLLDARAKLGGTDALVSGLALPGEKPEDLKRRLDMIKEIGKALADIGPKVNIRTPDVDIAGMAMKGIDAQMKALMDSPVGGGQMQTQLGEQLQTFDRLIASIEVYRHNIELTNMDLAAHGQSLIDVDKALGPLRDQATTMAVELRKALRAAGLDPAFVDLLVQHWLDGLKKIGNAGKDAASKLSSIADAMSQVADTANSLASLNDALRGNKNTSAFLGSVGSAASSIGSAVAQGGTNPAADLQALADTISVGNALTASSREIALEHKEMLKINNERLAEVSMRLIGFTVSAGTSSLAQQALIGLFANNSALSKLASGATHTGGLFGTGEKGDLQTQINALMPFLNSVGLTFEQFKKIAADNGFDILDKNGRLVTDALQQMKDKLDDVVRSLFTFQNTLADQKSLADLQQKLTGAPMTPQIQANESLDLLKKLAPALFPAGLSAQGGQNQDALRQFLKDLVAKIAAGEITAGDFGGFQNLQEFLNAVGGTVDALNTLRDVTNGVTAALNDVPTGFKLALSEFDAQSPEYRGLTPANVHPTDTGGLTLNIMAGAIAIDPTNKNASEIGQETLTGLQALAGQKLGNRARWADLN